MPNLISETTPKARKGHRCDVCGMTIEAGTVYASQTCADDGRVYTWRQHPECAEIAREISDGGDAIASGDGENWLGAMGEEASIAAVDSDAAKARVRAGFADRRRRAAGTAYTLKTIVRLRKEGTVLAKFTNHRPKDLVRRWDDLPSKGRFDALLADRGLTFTTDAPQFGEYHGLTFTAYRYTLDEAPRD